MVIKFSHLRDRSTNGGWIDFAVFQADANSKTRTARNQLLAQLTMAARAQGLKIDQSALAFEEHGDIYYFGDPSVVKYLSNSGLPSTNYTLTV
jgi:hypothetical protein